MIFAGVSFVTPFLWGREKEERDTYKSEEEMNAYVYKGQLTFKVNKKLIKLSLSDKSNFI